MTEEVIDQAPEQSMEERIAGAMGLPAAEPVAEAPADDLFELNFEGAQYKVPAPLKEAFMRTEDYTKKTQELADQRRGYDQMTELAKTRQIEGAFHESIAAEQQEMSVIDAYLSQIAKQDMTAMTTEQLLRAKMEIDNVKERRAHLKEQIEGKRSKFTDDVKTRISELRGKSREMASKSIPNFSEQAEKEVREHATSVLGFTETEIENVMLDPRSVRTLWKAMQFDKVQSGVTKATAKVDKVLKVGAATERMPSDVRNKLEYGKAMKSARTSGEKANVIETRLESMFSRR